MGNGEIRRPVAFTPEPSIPSLPTTGALIMSYFSALPTSFQDPNLSGGDVGDTDVDLINIKEAVAILFSSLTPRSPNDEAAQTLCGDSIAIHSR